MTAFFVNRGGMPDILMEKQKTAPQDGFFFSNSRKMCCMVWDRDIGSFLSLIDQSSFISTLRVFD